jgi:multidrug efflux pump subunit AcrA (membrane-fusion protein)
MSTMESTAATADGAAQTELGTNGAAQAKRDTGGTAPAELDTGGTGPGPGGGPATEAPAGAQPQPSPAADPLPPAPVSRRRDRTVTAIQLTGGLVIAAVCAAAVLWYVPRIVRSDSRSFTGTVVSNGITNLNFANSGLMGRLQVQLGQSVRAGQVLATETSPATAQALSADRASIAAAQATLAALRAGPVTTETSASIAAANAQLAKAQAQLSADQVKLSEAQIIAPTAGTVIAINAQPGETVTSAGVRSYSGVAQTSNSQAPPFSLLPEGPSASLKSGSTQTALPVIALRTSTGWEVNTLVPENHISSVRPGLVAIISVPAVGLMQIRGVVHQVAPTPVSTSTGTAYEVTISITGHRQLTPLNGMTADVQLGS